MEEGSMATTIEEIDALVRRLPPERQKQVLEFARGLAQPERPLTFQPQTPPMPPTPGSALLRFKLPAEDVDAMERALEDCERIEPDED
jgi:hypothetical protein